MKEFKNLFDINSYQIELFHNYLIHKYYENLIDKYQNSIDNIDNVDFRDILLEISKIGFFISNID